MAALALGAATARVEAEPVSGLPLTVHPSGVEGAGPAETLDERLARRERGFRYICLGCIRSDGPASSSAPFEPIRTLNAAQLNAALGLRPAPAPEGDRDQE